MMILYFILSLIFIITYQPMSKYTKHVSKYVYMVIYLLSFLLYMFCWPIYGNHRDQQLFYFFFCCCSLVYRACVTFTNITKLCKNLDYFSFRFFFVIFTYDNCNVIFMVWQFNFYCEREKEAKEF